MELPEVAGDGKVVLHSVFSSSCGWRVRLALAYKEIPYELKSWKPRLSEHLSEEYTKINPMQLIPALEIDGEVLTDSVAILEYLEERFPDKKPLLPKGLKERAAIRSVVHIIASQIQPLQNLRVVQAIAEKAGEDAKKEWAQKWIVKGFHGKTRSTCLRSIRMDAMLGSGLALEIILAKTSGKYSFGNDFTLADVLLFPMIHNARRNKVDMGQFPTLETIGKNLLDLEIVVNSTPDRQPDYYIDTTGFVPRTFSIWEVVVTPNRL